MKFDTTTGELIEQTYGPRTRQRVLMVLGLTFLLTGLILLAQFLWEETPERTVLGGPPPIQDVRIIEDTSRPTPTPTLVPCELETRIGKVCDFSVRPTDVPTCPRKDNGPCVYDGPKSLIIPTHTPVPPLSSTPTYSGPGGTGTIATTPIFS